MSDLERLSATLRRYAEGRANDVKSGIETSALAALLVEKYAVGLVDAIRTLRLDIDINSIVKLADALCQEICSEHVELRQLRYERVADLDLSKHRKPI